MPAKTAKKAIRLPPSTQEQRNLAVKLYGQGATLKAICKTANITEATIYRALKEAGTPLRGRGYAGTDRVMVKAGEPVVTAKPAPAARRKRGVHNEIKEKLRDALALNARLKGMIVDMMLEKTR